CNGARPARCRRIRARQPPERDRGSPDTAPEPCSVHILIPEMDTGPLHSEKARASGCSTRLSPLVSPIAARGRGIGPKSTPLLGEAPEEITRHDLSDGTASR